MLRSYDAAEASNCLKQLTIIGDSTARQLFWALADKLNSRAKVSTGSLELSPLIARHANMSLEVGGGRELHFIWDPYLNSTSLSRFPTSLAQVVVISGGLWQARYLNEHHLRMFERHLTRQVAEYYKTNNKNRTASLPEATASNRPIFLPISPPFQPSLDSNRSETMTPERISAINADLKTLAKDQGVDVMWATLPMTDGYETAFDSHGLHVSDRIASQQLELLLNRLCNSQMHESVAHYCCTERDTVHNVQILILGSSLIFALLGMQQTIARLLGRYASSHSKLAHALAVFAAVGTYCFVADRTSLFEQVNKIRDERLFVIFCNLAILLGLATTSRILPASTDLEKDAEMPELEFLPRQQTEEWKGWMQVVILLYHYFGMSRAMWVYRLVRVLVASYLFLTSYGHTRYFANTNDLSLRRAVSVLVRINLLSCLLPYVMGTTYDFYYFPALSSLWFIVTWLTFPRTRVETVGLKQALIRILVSIALMEFLLQNEESQALGFSALRRIGMVSVDQREFGFRTKLDRFVPHLGMLAALLQHKHHDGGITRLPWLQNRRIGRATLTIMLSLLTFCIYFGWSKAQHSKEAINAWHPYTAPMPVMAYILLRNATPGLRNRYSRLFAWFGRHSLETFILQYHIWLAADTKGVLRLGLLEVRSWQGKTTLRSIGFWVEGAVITVLFLWVCSAVSTATSAITRCIVSPAAADGQELQVTPATVQRGGHVDQHGLALSPGSIWAPRCFSS